MMEELSVSLANRSYPIFIGKDVIASSDIASYINGSSVAIVTNEVVAPLYLHALKQRLKDLGIVKIQEIILPDGEEHKTLDTLNDIFTQLLNAQQDRSVTLFALGGGVIGDMTGFAAACYQRGVTFIQVPTTLLSQVDSSVGGKTAVNHLLGKNMIGAFYQPKCVLIDTHTLESLPDREWSAGLAEVIKYGLILDDDFLAWLEANIASIMSRDNATVTKMIYRSCQIKADIVAQDEKESGVRALLNLGHTFGHAIETEQGYGNWLHGEAVAVGMVMAARYSAALGWISNADVDRVEQLLQKCHLPIKPPRTMGVEQFATHMAHDKKVENGQLKLILLKSLGDAVISEAYDEETLAQLIKGFSW